jgi:hypothetical protein
MSNLRLALRMLFRTPALSGRDPGGSIRPTPRLPRTTVLRACMARRSGWDESPNDDSSRRRQLGPGSRGQRAAGGSVG